MDRWVGKTAVVTGASAGIGAAVCVALADAGLRVVGLARRAHLIDELKCQIRGKGTIQGRQCDVGNPSDIKEAFEWVEENFGGVHVMVNNAAALHFGHVTDVGGKEVTDEAVISTIDVNLKGLILCTRYAISSMKKQDFNGHIFNLSSILGHFIPSETMFNMYTSTKHAVTAFSGILQNELAHLKNKIKVTNLSPGLIKTDMVAPFVNLVDFEALLSQDIADVLLYVLSTPPNVNITELTVEPIGEIKG